jgi:hypothetical protein
MVLVCYGMCRSWAHQPGRVSYHSVDRPPEQGVTNPACRGRRTHTIDQDAHSFCSKHSPIYAMLYNLCFVEMAKRPNRSELLDADVELIVEGTFSAVGTVQDSIRFIRGEASGWEPLKVSSADPVRFEIVRMSGATWGSLKITSAPALSVADCVVKDNMRGNNSSGIVANGSGLRMEHAVVRDNVGPMGGGIHVTPLVVIMVDCKMRENSAIRDVLDDVTPVGTGGSIWTLESSLRVLRYSIHGNNSGLGLVASGISQQSVPPKTHLNRSFWR